MHFHDKTATQTATYFQTSLRSGLSENALSQNVKKYGYNKLEKRKEKGFFKRLLTCVSEPMIIILIFSLVIALGSNIGTALKGGVADFSECFGILFAVVLSVSITMIMEGSSKKAFDALNKIYDNVSVKVVRSGEIILVNQKYLTVGDVVLLESGDKIVADGRLIESNALSVDESALTGESANSHKNADVVLDAGVPLAERKNCVYSGTFVLTGSGKMLVTAVGGDTEIGRIAGELNNENTEQSPLQYKLGKLGKIITIVGVLSAGLIFTLSVVKLVLAGNLTFDSVRELFISCIVLIVAAVPEGLPTIVAVSLALNMIKLAKENALIKKMVATETAGAVSVICSDKTGTLTQNKMTVVSICTSEYCQSPKEIKKSQLIQNFICNSTADQIVKGNKVSYRGSGTECALLEASVKNDRKLSVKNYRESYKKVFTLPFSSQSKHMVTVIEDSGLYRALIKGAPEVVIAKCKLTPAQKSKILSMITEKQNDGKRVVCFAHFDSEKFMGSVDKIEYVYDGFACIADPLRPEVKKAVKDCKSAGIKIKMLTGDNLVTAISIAKELEIIDSASQAVNAKDLENLDDESFIKALKKVSVIARSTPIIKLRVVKALQKAGEVVAVTGDGINDAPAIKHADIGVAMGVSGSEITKEASDVVLLDDSFATVVKTVSFGRNVFKNIQRFILFQLSVNLSALLFITVCALVGVETPFNTVQLLWINVIMDGPPALTLGLESPRASLMSAKPVDKKQSIVGLGMLIRIVFNGVFIGGIMLMQYFTNFLGASGKEKVSATFTLFIVFQLFNAFNSRELGSQSIFKSLSKNKVMAYVFLGTAVLHLLIVQFGYSLYGGAPMSLALWLKCIAVAFSIVAVSEAYKLLYRIIKGVKAEGREKNFKLKKARVQ